MYAHMHGIHTWHCGNAGDRSGIRVLSCEFVEIIGGMREKLGIVDISARIFHRCNMGVIIIIMVIIIGN